MKKLIKKIGIVFKSLFVKTDKIWNGLTPEVQTAFLQGSKVLEIINQSGNKDGVVLRKKIVDELPDLDPFKLREGLIKVSEVLNLTVEITDKISTESILENIAKYLESKDKEIWASLSSLAAKLITHTLTGGKLLSWTTLELLMEFVYHNFIKEK